MSVPCPKCKNDVYRPYTSCSACGWVATGKWVEKARKLREKEDAQKRKEAERIKEKRRKRLGERAPPPAPIAPASSRKKRYPEIDVDSISDEDFEDVFGPMDDDENDDYVPIIIPCSCGAEILVETPLRPTRVRCPKCGKSGTLRKDPPNVRRVRASRPERKTPPPARSRRGKGGRTCPVCHSSQRSGKFCHNCGADMGSEGDNAQRHARIPSSGICSECGNLKLDFFDDGTGLCPKCGHSFRWDLHVSNTPAPSPPPPPSATPPPEVHELWRSDGVYRAVRALLLPQMPKVRLKEAVTMNIGQNKITLYITMVGDLERKVIAERGSRIEDVLRYIDLFPDGFVAIVDGRPVPMDTGVRDGMRVKLLKVASGG